MNDPEFPGEDEHLFFVLVEFNIEDVKELKRITQLELTGTLDADGIKAFVDVSWYGLLIDVKSFGEPYITLRYF